MKKIFSNFFLLEVGPHFKKGIKDVVWVQSQPTKQLQQCNQNTQSIVEKNSFSPQVVFSSPIVTSGDLCTSLQSPTPRYIATPKRNALGVQTKMQAEILQQHQAQYGTSFWGQKAAKLNLTKITQGELKPFDANVISVKFAQILKCRQKANKLQIEVIDKIFRQQALQFIRQTAPENLHRSRLHLPTGFSCPSIGTATVTMKSKSAPRPGITKTSKEPLNKIKQPAVSVEDFRFSNLIVVCGWKEGTLARIRSSQYTIEKGAPRRKYQFTRPKKRKFKSKSTASFGFKRMRKTVGKVAVTFQNEEIQLFSSDEEIL